MCHTDYCACISTKDVQPHKQSTVWLTFNRFISTPWLHCTSISHDIYEHILIKKSAKIRFICMAKCILHSVNFIGTTIAPIRTEHGRRNIMWSCRFDISINKNQVIIYGNERKIKMDFRFQVSKQSKAKHSKMIKNKNRRKTSTISSDISIHIL